MDHLVSDSLGVWHSCKHTDLWACSHMLVGWRPHACGLAAGKGGSLFLSASPKVSCALLVYLQVCFLPGSLILGATRGLSVDEARKAGLMTPTAELYVELAANLTHTCYEMSRRHRHGTRT